MARRSTRSPSRSDGRVRLFALLTLAVALAAPACASKESSNDGGTDSAVSHAVSAMRGTLYEPGRRFGQLYCAPCHALEGRDPKQKVAYPAFHVDTYEDWAASRTILVAVLDKWNPDGDVMPPLDAVEPPDTERRFILDWIKRGSPNTIDGESH